MAPSFKEILWSVKQMRINKQRLISFLLIIATAFSMTSFPKTVEADDYYDSYGNILWEDEILHLDNFSVYLQQDANAIGYIAFLVGKGDSYKKIKTRIDRAVRYLTKDRKLNKARLVIIYAGNNDETKTILQPYDKNLSAPKFSSSKDKIVTSEFKSLND
jgi:hypothetical protein